jgi:hypothetical protein
MPKRRTEAETPSQTELCLGGGLGQIQETMNYLRLKPNFADII